ncbi:nucleoporin FG repeat region-domain-containing protein [Lasiosphaeria ovina]|uniref:Nucleoporin FG repeat region-domain-containing protein n=1 Tax=Lasiosphaeria ovina TaxID=92902 RepID=A0AAE0MY42_9PEZI|nr:nucleoporin FG repeat region-domain-containing protein [Lasiosphaeria ovina]
MALARSASGPGGLSINTGNANIFGSNTTQAPAGGGLFGSSTSQPAQAGSLFGTATSQPQTTTSLFGATTNTQPQQTQQSGGLFGASTAQPQQTGGLFGSAPQQQQQQQTVGGGLFGNQQASQPQQQTGGLFGNTTTQPQQQQAGGLFGTAPAQPAQTGGLFGAAPQSQPAQPGSLFGTSSIQQQQQQQPQAGGGLFGSSTANTGGMFGPAAAGAFGQGVKPQGSLFAGLGQSNAQPQQQQQNPGFGQANQGVGLTMGQSANQQPQVVPGVRIDVSNIRSTTRFNDLQEDLQKQIAMIDEGIQKCIRDKEAVDAFLPAHGDQLSAIPTDVNFVTRKSEGADGALSGDLAAINQLRDLVKKDADNARLSFKAIDNLRLPTQYHQSGLWSTRGQQAATGAGSADADAESNSDLITFFSKTSDEMGEMMKKFERNLGEIEVHLHGVQGNMLEQLQRVVAQSKNGSQGGLDERVVELAAVLRDFEEGILKVAGVVGGVKEGITGLQLKDFMGHGI